MDLILKPYVSYVAEYTLYLELFTVKVQLKWDVLADMTSLCTM